MDLDKSPNSKVEAAKLPQKSDGHMREKRQALTPRQDHVSASACIHTARGSCCSADSDSVHLDSVLSWDLRFTFLTRPQKMPMLLDHRLFFQYRVLVDLPETVL